MAVKWTATKKERALINIMVTRARIKDPALNTQSVAMTIEAVHCNGNKLDLERRHGRVIFQGRKVHGVQDERSRGDADFQLHLGGAETAKKEERVMFAKERVIMGSDNCEDCGYAKILDGGAYPSCTHPHGPRFFIFTCTRRLPAAITTKEENKMNTFKRFSAAALLVLVMASTGCGKNPSGPSTPDPAPEVTHQVIYVATSTAGDNVVTYVDG